MISFREYLTENNKNTQQQIIEAFGNNIKHDTFYNRAAFENGRINLLLIMGHSGSGKTTLSDLAAGNPNVEVFHCDDIWGLGGFTSEQLKEYGNLINSFWNKETKKNPKLYKLGKRDYDRILFLLLRHAIKYAESHRNKVFILEGIQTAVPFMKWGGESSIKYELPRDYINKVAIIIKHTSALKSAFRAGIRNSKHKFMSNELEKNPFKRAADAFRFWTDKSTREMYRTTKYDIKKLKEKMKLNEDISNFKLIDLSAENIKKYKSKCKGLIHVRTSPEYIGKIFIDENDDVVGYVNVYKPDNFIQALEVAPEYRGQGFSKYLLKYAEKKLGAKKLSVNKKNTIAQNLYSKNGWKPYDEKDQMIFMMNEEISSYERPYTYNEVVKKYGKKLADKLLLDPAHKFRMTTGIELIHKEPSLEELKRIWRNWNLMSDDMKKKSDKVSEELFGINNKEHYTRLLKEYV